MHRIDGAGATVDGKFTEGDPLGGVQATAVTAPWLNDMQEELMSVLTAGGITPVKGTQDQLLKSIRTLSVGIIGSARNVKMSVATASASATLTADQIIVGASLSGQAYRLASFSKTINLATTGAGGMDTGTAPVSGFVALYAIYNPTTGISALLGVNATSAVASNVYTGASLPAGYTASALLSVWPTNSSAQLVVGAQKDRDIRITRSTALTTSVQQGSFTSVSLANIVPPNAVSAVGDFAIVNATSVTTNAVASASSGLAALFSPAGVTNSQSAYNIPIITQQTLFYLTVWTGSGSFQMQVSGYSI